MLMPPLKFMLQRMIEFAFLLFLSPHAQYHLVLHLKRNSPIQTFTFVYLDGRMPQQQLSGTLYVQDLMETLINDPKQLGFRFRVCGITHIHSQLAPAATIRLQQTTLRVASQSSHRTVLSLLTLDLVRCFTASCETLTLPFHLITDSVPDDLFAETHVCLFLIKQFSSS